jgi:hypothetical protein
MPLVGLPLIVAAKKDLVRIGRPVPPGHLPRRQRFSNETKNETLDELGFELPDLLARGHHVFDPDLGAVANANHFRTQAVVGGKSEKSSGQNQVRLERISHLDRGHTLTRQGKSGIARQYRNPRRTCRSEPCGDLIGNRRAEVLGDVLSRNERHNHQA